MKNKTVKIKMLALTMVAATAVGMAAPSVAFASTPTAAVPTSQATPNGNVKTVGAHKASETAPLILGGELKTGDPTSLSANEQIIFGSDYNSAPSAYMRNYYWNQNNGTASASVTLQKIAATTGPNIADLTIPSGGTTSVTLSVAPDILLGTAANANNETYNDYLTYTADQVAYDVPKLSSRYNDYSNTSSTLLTSTMTGLMKNLATELGSTGRYSSSPSTIASTYEHYVKDLQLYILSQVSTKKKVAIVANGASGYLNVYEFVPTTAQTTSRAAEYLKYTTTNALETSAFATPKAGMSSAGVATIATSDISKYFNTTNVDYVVAMNPTSTSSTLSGTNLTNINAAGFTTTAGNLITTSPDSAFGLYMNSVDNALGMATLNAQIYSSVLPMNEVAAYFYQNLYHINASDVDTVVNANFQSIPTYSTISDSTESTLVSNCASKISAGNTYYTNNSATIIANDPDIAY